MVYCVAYEVFSAAHLEQLLAVVRAEAKIPSTASLRVLDGLVSELGLVDMQKYVQMTAPHRASWHDFAEIVVRFLNPCCPLKGLDGPAVDSKVTRTIRHSQEEGQHARNNNSREKRALVICSLTMPSDCWRAYGMRISGEWTDQGWGNTDVNKVEIRAVTAGAGLVYVQIHSVNWNSDSGRIEVKFGGAQLGQGLDEEDETGRKNLDLEQAESLLEVLTAGDLVQITMACVSWGGHEAHAENTCLEIDYFTRDS